MGVLLGAQLAFGMIQMGVLLIIIALYRDLGRRLSRAPEYVFHRAPEYVGPADAVTEVIFWNTVDDLDLDGPDDQLPAGVR